MAELIERLREGLAGRYLVERELGQGGMAIVFLARDLRHARQVAIKVLKPELATSLGAERFLREIRTTAQIVHPHVLPLHDSGELGDLLYYIMPFVSGESLADRLEREGALPVRDAVRIAREVADGLAHAHALDVVHRDIKPGNILLSAGSHAAIADFGLARALHAAANTRLTSTGITVGSPLYMSPEQIGGAEQVDGRADVYGLGCMLFEMLAGRPPFEGPTLPVVLRKHLLDPPPSLRESGVAVPERLDELVRWALAKDPADRPTAEEFRTLLGQLDVHFVADPTTPGLRSRPGAGSRWTGLRSALRRMRRRDRVAGGATALLLTAGAAWGLWRLSAGDGAPGPAPLEAARVAVLYFDDHSPGGDLAYLANGLTEGLIQELGQVDALDVVSRNGVKPFRGAAVSTDSIARALNVGSIVEGSVTRSGDRVRVNVRLVDGRSAMQLDTRQLDARLDDPLALQDSLVREVAESLRRALGREVRLRQTRRATDNDEAWALVNHAQALRDEFLQVRVSDYTAARAILARADTTAARAGRLDPRWSSPSVVRGWLARDRALLEGATAGKYDPEWGERALAYADQAIRVRPDDASAYELRGVLKLEFAGSQEGERRRQLIRGAEADLRRATEYDAQRARAWWALSELLVEQARFAEGKLAAERALRADAYLENAASVIHQVYYSALQLGPNEDAVRSCNEGRRRFPRDSRFVLCQLFVRASFPGAPTDLASARRLADSLALLVPAKDRAEQHAYGKMLAASVAARAGLPDSAYALIREAGSDSVFPHLAYDEAHARLLLGEHDAAVELLSRYLKIDPDTAFIRNDWWFEGLRDHPGFRRVVGLAP